LGILYMQIGRLDEAVNELKKAVALRPENGDAWAILAARSNRTPGLKKPGMRLKRLFR